MISLCVPTIEPKRSYAHLTFGVLKSIKMEEWAFKVWGLSLGQLPIEPESILLHHPGLKL